MSREFWIVEVHPVEWEDPTGLFYYFASESKARRFVEYAEAKAGVVHATMWRDGTGTLTERLGPTWTGTTGPKATRIRPEEVVTTRNTSRVYRLTDLHGLV